METLKKVVKLKHILNKYLFLGTDIFCKVQKLFVGCNMCNLKRLQNTRQRLNKKHCVCTLSVANEFSVCIFLHRIEESASLVQCILISRQGVMLRVALSLASYIALV